MIKFTNYPPPPRSIPGFQGLFRDAKDEELRDGNSITPAPSPSAGRPQDSSERRSSVQVHCRDVNDNRRYPSAAASGIFADTRCRLQLSRDGKLNFQFHLRMYFIYVKTGKIGGGGRRRRREEGRRGKEKGGRKKDQEGKEEERVSNARSEEGRG